VAGLVRSIYGAVNDSIKVPQGGKKTIKVKLTVTPENKSGGFINNGLTDSLNLNDGSSPQPLPPQLSSVLLDCKNNNLSANNTMGNTQGSPSSAKLTRNNVNVTIEENSVMNRESRSGSGRRGGCGFLDKPKFNSVRLPNSGGHSNYCKCSRNFCPEVFRDCGVASPLRNRKKWRERPCSLKRPDLLDLLQANMEKNNVSPCCRHISQVDSHANSNSCSHHHSHNNQNPLITTSDPSVPLPLFANENFWKQKLADITQQMSNNNSSSNNNYLPHRCHHSKGHNVVTNNHSHSHHHNSHQCKKTGGGGGHHRSRSHDLSQNVFRCHYVHHSSSDPSPPTPVCCSSSNPPGPHHHHHQQMNINPNLMNPESCTDLHGGCVLASHHHNHHQLSPRSKNTNVLQNANNSGGIGTTNASPHQIKHRNREQEHARAMAQVISWLERENIGGKEGNNMKLRFASPKRRESPSSGSNNEEKILHQVHQHQEEHKEEQKAVTPPESTGSPSTVKKHEHHHVHEHIHHHYHHHFPKETPIIV